MKPDGYLGNDTRQYKMAFDQVHAINWNEILAPAMLSPCTGQDKIEAALKNLKSNKALGTDNLPA
jgi:hypothetical protein